MTSLNIHPIFVHFPIAFFTIYAIEEFLRFKKLLAWTPWFYIKAVLVMVGFGGALLAIVTGVMAKSLFPPESRPPQLNTHEAFAITTSAIFGLLAFGYLVAWLERANCGQWMEQHISQPIWQLALWLKRWLNETPLTVVLALVGLVSVFITGALGGSMVYGPEGDPFIKLVYHLLVK